MGSLFKKEEEKSQILKRIFNHVSVHHNKCFKVMLINIVTFLFLELAKTAHG